MRRLAKSLYAMRKQNHISAVSMISLSVICFAVGYWSADIERKEIAKFLLNNIDSGIKSDIRETKIDLDILVSLQDGDIEAVNNFLLQKVKIRLKHHTSKNSELYKKAIAYQNKYCENKCLGI